MTATGTNELLPWPASISPWFDPGNVLHELEQHASPAATRTAITHLTEALVNAFSAQTLADDLVHARAAFTDRILNWAWNYSKLGEIEGLSLIAVGGYGRGELLPCSDIDLLLLSSNPVSEKGCEIISGFVRLLWDIGLQVGHSVRTLEECEQIAAKDISIVTNLMESRLLTGNHTLYLALQECIDPDRIWPSREFFAAKLLEQQTRYRKFGDTAYRLEPNIKEGPGGLRDIQMVGWVSKRHLRLHRLSELVQHGFLTSEEYVELKQGQSYLWRIRFALHSLAGRAEERLLFDHQHAIAELFGYHGEGANLAVEQFMQSYYRTVMGLERLNEILLQHYREAILESREPAPPVILNERFQHLGGYIEVRNPDIFREQPSAIFEILLLIENNPDIKGVRASTIRRLRQARNLIDEHFRQDPVCNYLFMEILRQPHGVTAQLRRMNRYGILPAYIPAFDNIVGRMQYDLFHAYTVDEHTLRVVRNLRRLSTSKGQRELPFCARLFAQIPAPELLYLAALFHDIAKGRGGDHSTLGAADAEAFCRQHGLSPADTALVSWLVRNHLILSMTAQRKDISDPEIVREFARQVTSRKYLDHLFLLTVADIRGTNPTLWNSWRQSLLIELYQATGKMLDQGLQYHPDGYVLITQIQNDALQLLHQRQILQKSAVLPWEDLSEDYFLLHSPDEIAWHTANILEGKNDLPIVRIRSETPRGGSEIFVFSEELPYLFAHIASTLDRLGLNIVSARITSTRHGKVLDSFMVLESDGAPIQELFRIQEITDSLTHILTQAEQPPVAIRRRQPRRLRHFDEPPKIYFRQDDSTHWTSLHLIATDRPGLLATVANVLMNHHIVIHSAKIATLGAQVDDTFYITDKIGQSIPDECHQQRVCRDLLAVLNDSIQMPTNG